MDLEAVIAKIGAADFTLEQAIAFSQLHGLSLNRLFDLASLHVARRYRGGAITFDDADCIMNGLWGLIFQQPVEKLVIPEITQDIFDAFDQGEYHHAGDSHEVDPEAKYTKPLLAAAMAKHDA